MARRLVAEHVVELQRPYWRALGYEVFEDEDGELKLRELEGGGAKMTVPFWGEVVVSAVEDLGAQIAAAEKLQDRALGRPRQQVELSGDDGGPIQIEGDLTDPDVKEALHDVARAIDASRRRD